MSVAQRWTLDFVGRKCPVLATYPPGSVEFAVASPKPRKDISFADDRPGRQLGAFYIICLTY
jgi:hypothetical protein